MPARSRPARLRTILATTGALGVLLPAPAATAGPFDLFESLLDRPTPADEALAPERRDAPPARARTTPARDTAPAPEAPAPPTIATVRGVELVLPTPDTLAIGFHEGATRSLDLSPVFDVPEGTPVPVVMGSRGRGTGAATAIDIAVEDGSPIAAPVTGKVVEANSYALYGSTDDVLITIAPDAAPQLRVRMFHFEAPKVGVGDAVVAGETVIAERSRVLPFSSQIDRITGRRAPHVHVQVDNG